MWEQYVYLLLQISVGENVFHSDVKFAHVVFAPSVSVPADTLDQWYAHEGHVEADLPFWVEILADGWGRLFRRAQVYDQVLH